MVCGISVNAALARSPRQDGISGNDLMWSTLLRITTQRARPMPQQPEIVDELQRKLYVLGNLLDCAVQAPDKQLRRQYIGRIMGLPKHSQKTIMAMIEQRASGSKRHGSSAHKHSPSRSPRRNNTPSRIVPPSPSRQSRNSISSQQPTAPSSSAAGPLTPQLKPTLLCSAQSAPQALAQLNCSNSAQQVAKTVVLSCQPSRNGRQNTPPPRLPTSCTNENDKTHPASRSAGKHSTPMLPNTPVSPMRSALKKPNSPSRGHSVAFSPGSESGYTPERKRPNSTDRGAAAPFLSPGSMESPNKVQSVMQLLHRKNESLKKALGEYQQRDEEHKKKTEQMEAEFKQRMMKVEAQSLDRIQSLQQEFETHKAELEEKLGKAQQEAEVNANAVHELAAAKEELEVMQHSKAVLAEKLRKFKEKLAELQDVKEALQKEQVAHGHAVDEIVRLENEMQSLQPFKKQVEDYKIRAVEAEVKLVECQDYLRRMEQQMKDKSSENEYMFKDAFLQKEQMEELQRRIQEDTQYSTNQNDDSGVYGVGDGISELNPEIKQELIRLRNENLQLRAFQVKRSNDAVRHLEESLDESKRFVERYKHEYLSTKKSLAETKAALSESIQREANLQDDNMQWQDNFHELEQQCANIKHDLMECEKELERTKHSLQEAETQNERLRQEIQDWMKTSQENEVAATGHLEELQKTQKEFEETNERLQSAMETIEKLSADVETLETEIEDLTERQEVVDVELDKTAWELDNSRNKLAEKGRHVDELEKQIKRMQKQQDSLEADLEKERSIRKEESEVGQEALETTRHLLETKNRKDLEELQTNMNRLLEAERKAYRIKDEEASHMLMKSEKEWHEKYVELQERSASSLKHSRQEAQERIDFIKKEYDLEMEKIRKESGESQDKLVRKGRQVLEEAKSKATEEMQRLESECQDLENKNHRLEQEKEELDRLLKGKIVSLQQQLQFTSSQVEERTREADEYIDHIKKLEREKYKLSEENEQYRRQIGGRYGADGKTHSQLEKLQKEYNSVVDENRKLKMQVNSRGDLLLASISEGDDAENGQSYRKNGGVDRQALMELRKEYEERIEELNDEKRDLIMKNASAATDVHKAEKRAWEREDDISRLQQEITSLKLMLQRADLETESLSSAHQENSEKLEEIARLQQENAILKLQLEQTEQNAGTHTGTQSGLLVENSAQSSGRSESLNKDMLAPKDATPATPPRRTPGQIPSPGRGTGSPSKIPRSSPSIDRAKKQKAVQEELIRNRFTSITGLRVSPPVATASRKSLSLGGSIIDTLPSNSLSSDSSSCDEYGPPENAPTSPSSMASDVFKLGWNTSAEDNAASTNTNGQTSRGGASLLDYTQLNGKTTDGSQPECAQS